MSRTKSAEHGRLTVARQKMAVDAKEIIKGVASLEVPKPISDTLGEAWNALVGDRVTAFRLKNAANLQVKVVKELEAVGLKMNPAKIPERYALAWFEDATKQDEPEIQDLFARLLAKAASGDKDASDRRHLEIVSRLTPMDAAAMNFFFKISRKKDYGQGASFERDIHIAERHVVKAVIDELGHDAWSSIEHLIALGVIVRSQSINPDSVVNVLMMLKMSAGEIFPVSSDADLEVVPHLGPTSLGASLRDALALSPQSD